MSPPNQVDQSEAADRGARRGSEAEHPEAGVGQLQQDAVPGRFAQLWFEAEQEGIYFGQCSELCGKDHAYMPITVKVVDPVIYEEWLAQAKQDFPA